MTLRKLKTLRFKGARTFITAFTKFRHCTLFFGGWIYCVSPAWYLHKIYDCVVFVCTSIVRQVSRIFHGGGWGPDHEAVFNLYLILKSALWKSFRKYMCSCIYIHTDITTCSMTHWPNLNKKFYSSWFFNFIQDFQIFFILLTFFKISI